MKAEGEVETTLMVNVGSVNDLRHALRDVPHDRRIEVKVPVGFVSKRFVLDEVTIHDDGHVVLYVGLEA